MAIEEEKKNPVEPVKDATTTTTTTEEKKGDDDEEDAEFIKSLLNPDSAEGKKETKEETEEEKRLKNKNAEEARKRREAEAKLASEKAQKEKDEAEALAKKTKEDADKKAKEEAEKKARESSKQTSEDKLGDQLVSFKNKYPDVDLAKLDEDKNFKRFIDGKLLGRKDFTVLFEEYVEMKTEMSNSTKAVVQNNYIKAKSSSGSSSKASETPAEIYSEEEMRKIAEKLPFMSRKTAEQVEAKYNKSIAYYDKK